MPKVHKLYREQTIQTDLETAWKFVSRPENLNKITPDDLDFNIITDLPEVMSNGLIIEYRIGIPLLGKQTWLTEIKHIRDHHSFVDEQRIGPYKLWYHYHEINETPAGIQFIDQVHYALPYGPCGAIAHTIYVKNKLQQIFNYRQTALPKVLS